MLHANVVPKTLLEAVRAKRIAMKMNLREFGKAIGRNMWAATEWENGHSQPNPESRQKLVDWLGYDPEASA